MFMNHLVLTLHQIKGFHKFPRFTLKYAERASAFFAVKRNTILFLHDCKVIIDIHVWAAGSFNSYIKGQLMNVATPINQGLSQFTCTLIFRYYFECDGNPNLMQVMKTE